MTSPQKMRKMEWIEEIAANVLMNSIRLPLAESMQLTEDAEEQKRLDNTVAPLVIIRLFNRIDFPVLVSSLHVSVSFCTAIRPSFAGAGHI